MADPTVIVVGNEKGGAGKSTLAIHIACGLLHAGKTVAIIDLDLRQRSMAKFFANRAAWTAGNGQALPMPFEPDMGEQVDPVTLDLLKPSIYSESVWEARKHRAVTEGRAAAIDWIVVVNRMAVAAARNRQRLEERMEKLARRVGFRIGPGLRDRVIYRELFPFGLTVADLSNEVRPVAVSLAHVAARQELRNLMLALGLDGGQLDAPLDAAA